MNLIRIVWLAGGFMFLGLGILGIPLPILPTTPFLLAALFCFTKGSKRVHTWFLTTSLYKNHVKEFNETRAMTLKSKIYILSFASSMLLVGYYFSDNVYARITIAVLIVIKYYVFIFKINTANEKTKKHLPNI